MYHVTSYKNDENLFRVQKILEPFEVDVYYSTVYISAYV
jgi:hypothetical protein